MSDLHVLQDDAADVVRSWDWNSWLGAATISTSAWAIEPSAGVTLNDLGHSAGVASVRVGGLTAGNDYNLTNTITTSSSETEKRTIVIRCRKRGP